jgi:hypothetical protein
MPRTLRVEYPGAIYQSRGHRRQSVFLDEVEFSQDPGGSLPKNRLAGAGLKLWFDPCDLPQNSLRHGRKT